MTMPTPLAAKRDSCVSTVLPFTGGAEKLEGLHRVNLYMSASLVPSEPRIWLSAPLPPTTCAAAGMSAASVASVHVPGGGGVGADTIICSVEAPAVGAPVPYLEIWT